MDVLRQLQTRSHSLPSLRSSSPAVTITILPLGSTSTRATICPAAVTASTARLRSAFRKVAGARVMVRKSAYRQSCGAPTERCLKIVEAVALGAERRLVAPAVGRDGAGRTLDRCRRLGKRDDLSAAKQPDQTGL